MIKSAKPPYCIHFLNCPKELTKEKFAELFETKAEDIENIEGISETNGVSHTVVSVSNQDIALNIFDKYSKDNVRLEFIIEN